METPTDTSLLAGAAWAAAVCLVVRGVLEWRADPNVPVIVPRGEALRGGGHTWDYVARD